MRAAVHSDDRSCGAYLLEEFGNGESGSTADVEEDPVAGLRAERVVDQFAAADHIVGAVAGVELLG
jgi:hypothetical protein